MIWAWARAVVLRWVALRQARRALALAVGLAASGHPDDVYRLNAAARAVALLEASTVPRPGQPWPECGATYLDPCGSGLHRCVLPPTHVLAALVPDPTDRQAHACSVGCGARWYEPHQMGADHG